MKKRALALLMAAAMLLGVGAIAATGEKTIDVVPMTMTINGQAVTPLKSDGAPAEVFAYDGATYVPMRYLAELLGYEVKWDAEHNQVAQLVSDKLTVPAVGPQTLTGTGSGFGGPVTAAVTVENGKITAVKLTGEKETPAIGGAALPTLEERFVAAGSADIDAVTNATLTSNGAIEAVKAALAGDSVGKVSFQPGTYTAAHDGMGGPVPVTVTFSKDAIVNIEIGQNKETAGIAKYPIEALPKQIMETQNLAVDAVSGVTVTSKAILAGVEDCVKQAGGNVSTMKTWPEKAPVAPAEDVHCDILVVGGGAAGITAGINAKYNGVDDVILIEKLSFCGGSSALSGGVITRVAMEGDPEGTMTRDEMMDYFHSYEGNPDESMLEMYVDNSVDEWKWFVGLEGGDVYKMFHNTPENVFSTSPMGGGMEFVDILLKEAEKVGLEIRTKNDAQELITDASGAVIGVKVINQNGAEQNYYADAVVLATGGFANNRELLERFAGNFAAEGVVMKGAGGANGDGIIMGEKVGAALHFGDAWDTSGQNTAWITTLYWYGTQSYSVFINDEGNRYVREDWMLPKVYEAMVCGQLNSGHTGGFWIISGNDFYKYTGGTQADVDKAVAMGEIFKCDTIADIAKVTGAPEANLKKTLEGYAAMTTEDPDFGKDAKYLGGIDLAGPFYVAATKPQRSGTMGGLVINTKAQVLDTNGNPIPGLLAAGETANGNFFDNYYYLCGNMDMHALITGHAAGDTATEMVKK